MLETREIRVSSSLCETEALNDQQMAQITVIADEGACTTHDPAYENILGGKESYREAPRRLSDLLTLFRSHPEVYRVLDAYDYGIQPLLACHDGDYLDFLRGCYHQWVATGGSKDGVVSRIAYHPHFAQLSQDHPPIPSELSLDGRIGLYSWDLGHTITKGAILPDPVPQPAVAWHRYLWRYLCCSPGRRDGRRLAQGSQEVRERAFRLCRHVRNTRFVGLSSGNNRRPPGHHAGSACTGGYCYINNAAIAARRLQAGDTSTRIAIVDLDAHFGNGTADIFAADPSVLYVSLHADKTFPRALPRSGLKPHSERAHRLWRSS